MSKFRLFTRAALFSAAALVAVSVAAPASATLLGDDISISLGGRTDNVTVSDKIEVYDRSGSSNDVPKPCNICRFLLTGEYIDVFASSMRFHFVASTVGTQKFAFKGLEWQDGPGSIIGAAIKGTSRSRNLSILSFGKDYITGQLRCTGRCDVYVKLDVEHVPEPGTLGLLGFGLTGIGALHRRRKANKAS